MANVRASGFRVLTDAIRERSCERQAESKTSRVIDEVDRGEIDDDHKVIPLHDLTGCCNVDSHPTEHVLGHAVVKGSVEKENGLIHRQRLTEIEPIIVSDVGVGDGLIDSSSGGDSHVIGRKSTGAAGEHALLERGSQSYTDLGKRIMGENRMAQANEVDIQAHSRRDRCHATELEPQKTEIIPENWPFFVRQFGSQEKGKFVVSDLVWGKVKSHPWWPGQIIDPSDASTLAIKCQKKDALLVAYFWDKTFAWCDESQLKPFFSNFSAFETQVGLDTFSSAVKSALKEVCRRIDAGTMCSCLNEKSLFKVYPNMENAGVREGFEYYTVDKSKVVNSLNPRGLLGFIRVLALDPCKGTPNKLLSVMSKYHIKAFHRWMTFMLEKQTEPLIVPTEGVNLPENTVSLADVSVPETPAMQISPSTPCITPVVNSSTEKPKRKRGRPRKTPGTTPIDTAVIEVSPDLSSKTNTGPEKALSGKRRKVYLAQTPSDKGFSEPDNMQDSSYWSEMSLRVQADAKLVVPAAKRPVIIPVADRKSDECIPTALLLSFNNRFCKVPLDMEILRIFSQYGPLKGGMEKEVEKSQSRVKLVFKKRADAEMAFGRLRKQNVFGSSLLSYRLVDLPSSEVADSSEREIVEGDGEDHGVLEERRVEVNGEDRGLLEERRAEVNGEDHGLLEERKVEVNGEDHGLLVERRTEVLPGEFNPTTLLLSFSCKSGKIPSEMELIRMFSHHGPLKEGGVEKEVEGTTYRFRIAFKKHSSAQMAFTSLRKQNVFGSSLLSYRLISLLVKASKKSGQDKVKEPNKEKHGDLEELALKEKSGAIVHNRTERPVHTAVGLASTVQSDSVTDISVDPSSIAHGGSSSERSIASSSTVQGMNIDEVPIAPAITISDKDRVDPRNQKQDEDAAVTLVDPSSSVQGADVREMSIDPPSSTPATELLVGSSCTIETCEILPDSFLSTMQGERLSEIPIDSSSTEGKTVGEVLIFSSRIPGEVGGGDKMPIVKLRAEDGEVDGRGKMPSNSSSTREKDDLFEMQIDPSGTGQIQEPRPKKLGNSMAEKQAMAVEISRSAKPKPISNGSVLLECSPSRSAIYGCNTAPQFQKTSPLWQPLESLELFTRTPQQPHFKKLDRYCPEMRDGMAIGLMVTYANLMDSIKMLSFDDDAAVIEQKCTCLETLEENGFNVNLIRMHLNRILQLKTDHVRSGLKQAELEKELAKRESESRSMHRLIEKIRSDVVKLDEQINALTEQSRTLVAERDQLLELTVGNGHEISRLKNELSIVNRSQGPAREEFARVLAEPF